MQRDASRWMPFQKLGTSSGIKELVESLECWYKVNTDQSPRAILKYLSATKCPCNIFASVSWI